MSIKLLIKTIIISCLLFICGCSDKGIRIPEGFSYLEGDEEKGYVVTDASGNEYVWIPVKDLARYDFDNNTYVENNKAIDRIFYGEERKESVIYGMEYDIDSFKRSVKKYGGFYISRYLISKDGNSKANEEPYLHINRDDALNYCLGYYKHEDIISVLTSSYAYDAMMLAYSNGLENIKDMDGKYSVWTSEYCSSSYYTYVEDCVSRSSNMSDDRVDLSKRNYNSNVSNEYTGFRMVIYFK